MESRSRETTPTKEDLDFIVDDGYRHDVDPDYVPNEKYLVSGKEFKKLARNAKKLGAESLDYSTRKNNKYMATLPGGKKIHFGSPKFTKIKREEINILLVLQKLKTNREN